MLFSTLNDWLDQFSNGDLVIPGSPQDPFMGMRKAKEFPRIFTHYLPFHFHSLMTVGLSRVYRMNGTHRLNAKDAGLQLSLSGQVCRLALALI